MRSLVSFSLVVFVLGCSSDKETGSEVSGSGGGSGGMVLATGGTGALASGGGTSTVSFPPDRFGDPVTADIGAWALGPEYLGSAGSGSSVTPGAAGATGDACSGTLGLVRDFGMNGQQNGHPDFETFAGDDATPGLVQDTLGADGKPVYAGICDDAGVDPNQCPYDQQLTTQTNFDQWYRDVPDVNRTYYIAFQLQSTDGVVYTFHSSAFFPLDDAGWGNQGEDHNFGFTTELHTSFLYNGGETFTFTGDDDLWVFINRRLAIDLGGLHPQTNATIDLDASAAELGITTGNVYEMALFHAERHTNESNFRIDTTMHFVDCGIVPPLPPE